MHVAKDASDHVPGVQLVHGVLGDPLVPAAHTLATSSGTGTGVTWDGDESPN